MINATGILIHTNLGRSPLGTRSAKALQDIATGYSNLEFNLADGLRVQEVYIETALATLGQALIAGITAHFPCPCPPLLYLRLQKRKLSF